VRVRRALSALGVAAMAGTTFVVAAGGPSIAATTYDVINGTANATPVHIIAGSDAFTNFRTGAIDNSYPLAHSHIDGAPASEAAATFADTGPLVQTGVGTANPMLPAGVQVNQVQYATAHYPPGTTTPATFGSAGGPYASADATATAAHATATLASAAAPALPVTPPAAPASANQSSLNQDALRAVLTAWRRAWLNDREAAMYPMPRASAAQPDGTDGDTGLSSVSLDAGGLTTIGESRVLNANFANGLISISGLRVAASITNDGTPKHSITVKIAEAAVGGIPVTISTDGVSIATTALPGIAPVRDQAVAALNSALAAAGVSISLVNPTITTTAGQETIDAFGVRIQFDQPPSGPGVPSQHVTIVLGEAFVDALAVPGEALDTSDESTTDTGGGFIDTTDNGGSDLFGVLGDTTSSGGVVSTPRGRGTSPNVAGGSLVSTVRKKPTDLVLLYFLWQSTLIGTLFSLWWRRQELLA